MQAAPNFKDPRTQRRAVNVFAFCKLNLHPDRATELHNKKLQEVFGNRGNPTSDWLRELLLIRTDQRYRAWIACKPGESAQSYSYLLNAEGMTALKHQLDALSLPELVDTIKADNNHELEIESGDFGYRVGKASTRLNHPLQHIKREEKAAFWASRGYHWNYDIEASAPTMLYQLAMKHGMTAGCLGAVESYLSDRQAMREHVAKLAGIDETQAKDIINGLFNGAILAANFRNSIFTEILKGDRAAMARLQEDKALNHLRGNISRMWKKIGEGLGVSVRTAKEKARVYFPTERRVLDAMRDELREQGARHFCEHDGFVSDIEVDVSLLQEKVAQVTGLSIKLSLKFTSMEKGKSKGLVGCSDGVYKSVLETDKPKLLNVWTPPDGAPAIQLPAPS